MDKQLKDLKTKFEKDIPTSFTEKDKQAIRSKINQLTDKQPRRRSFRLYPQLLTGVVIAVTILIVAVTINNQPNMFNSSDKATDAESEKTAELNTAEAQMDSFEGETAGEEDSAGMAESNSLGNVFNPETVQHDPSFSVENIEENSNEIIITFSGAMIAGNFMNNQPLEFQPTEESRQEIPIAMGDEAKEIPIFISNEEFARAVYKSEIENSAQLSLQVTEINYHYSPEGSSIYVKVADQQGMSGIAIQSYSTTIALSKELQAVYEDYKASLDDKLLSGLNPIDVFKIYQHATYKGDLEVEYALYYKQENHYYPDKETFLAEASYSENNAAEFYQSMLEVKSFEEFYLNEEEVLIRYTLDNLISFRLYKDSSSNVWKVSYLPIQ
ncbi:hypothetical protein [Ornithinibacillus xuwenensis]|uniref:Uncharacterized protein n=1 Tax=Ornithinibacillus xuwenensis TaxID=3144668 RepID=A0ABU9XGC0_9BACI